MKISKSAGTYKDSKNNINSIKNNKIIIKKSIITVKTQKSQKSGQDRHLPGDPKKWPKLPKTSYFRISRNGCLVAKAAPGTNRSRAGTANQKPQSHCEVSG